MVAKTSAEHDISCVSGRALRERWHCWDLDCIQIKSLLVRSFLLVYRSSCMKPRKKHALISLDVIVYCWRIRVSHTARFELLVLLRPIFSICFLQKNYSISYSIYRSLLWNWIIFFIHPLRIGKNSSHINIINIWKLISIR